MKLLIKAGTTSQVLRIFIADATSTVGAGLAGLAFGTSGLKWSSIREDQSTVTVITPVTATVGTWTSAGFKEVDGTNFPGLYEIGIPNAALASGKTCQMLLFGASNMVAVPIEIELTAVDVQSATGFVTSVPSVVGNVGGNVSGNVAGSVASVGSAVTLDLTQALTNVKTGTVGGALHGAWTVAFGNVARNIVAKTLSVFGFASTTVPIATFAVDDSTNPTTRTLQ